MIRVLWGILFRFIPKRFSQPNYCANIIKPIIDHEIGHQLDFLLGLKSNLKIKALFSAVNADSISRYAMLNIAKFIAESWAEDRNNPNSRSVQASWRYHCR